MQIYNKTLRFPSDLSLLKESVEKLLLDMSSSKIMNVS